MKENVELKNILARLMSGFYKLFSSGFFKERIDAFLKQKYDQGLLKAEKFFNMNFVRNEENYRILNDYINGLVGNITDDINNRVREEIIRAKLDGINLNELKRRLRDTFKEKTFYNRINTVIRTEGNRAASTAQLDAAKQSGTFPYKYLQVVMDDVTSPICKKEYAKYGSKEQAIPLNKEFVVRYKNKTYRSQQPPFHINCRTSLRFVEGCDIVARQESDGKTAVRGVQNPPHPPRRCKE